MNFIDNRCSDKAVRCWQFASVVVEEGGEVHTVNLCQQCCNKQMVQQGKPRPNAWQWKAVVEKKAHRGRMWKMMGNEQFTKGMCEYCTLQRAEAKKILEDAARERQEGIQGQRQQESPSREVLEQVRGNVDMGCSAQIMRKGYIAMRDDNWEEFRKWYGEKKKSSEWTLEKTREACEKVAKEENWTFGHCAGNSEDKYGLLEKDYCASRWKGRSHFVVFCPYWNSFPLGGPHLVGLDRTRR